MFHTKFLSVALTLCLFVSFHANKTEASCECKHGDCSSDDEDEGPCILKEKRVKYFCCTSAKNGNINCDCRDEDDCIGNSRFQNGVCSKSIMIGRSCCKK